MPNSFSIVPRYRRYAFLLDLDSVVNSVETLNAAAKENIVPDAGFLRSAWAAA